MTAEHRSLGAAANRVFAADFSISRVLTIFSAIEAVVLLVSGGGSFFAPSRAKTGWPWAIAPFNSRFTGAIYISSLIAILALLSTRRWSPSRVVLPMIGLFTACVFVVSLAYHDQFLFSDRPIATCAWFLLYAALPISAGVHWWQWRGRPVADPVTLPPSWLTWLRTLGSVLGGYGVMLLLAPGWASSFWPWQIDSFHGRLYASTFLAGGIGMGMITKAASRLEVQMVGLMQVALGALAGLGLLWTDAQTNRVDWTRPGTWGWLAFFVVGGGTGLGLLWVLRRRTLPVRWADQLGAVLEATAP